MNPFLQKAFQENNYTFPPEPFAHYLELLQRWNRVFNLTAIRDPNEMVILHILDSLAINPYLHGQRIIDVGTGAGLPGIPLALVNPDKHFVLLDSNSKKTRFLIQAITDLNIKNIEVIHSRCEDFQPQQNFDSIISRAFASLEVMLATTRHLIAHQGQFLAMKGVYPHSEIADLSEDFKIVAVENLKINGLGAQRCLVKIELAER
jgi:16S rRNA (guanine527-N7)-methyltransferase